VSALTQEKEIMAKVAALAIIQRELPAHADDVFQLLDADHDRAVLAMYLDEAADILAQDREGVPIGSAQQEAALVALQGRAYKVEKAIEELRQRRVKPLQDETKAINALLGTGSNPGGLVFGPLLARMGKGGDADRRQAAWRAAERSRIAREQEEAQRRQIEAARAEQAARALALASTDEYARAEAKAQADRAALDQQRAELAAPLPQVRGVKTEDGRKSYHEEWTFEVVDPDQVPREFLMVNEQAIRAAVKAGRRQIHGVNIWQAERSRRGV
jgi:hypothetical protein